MSDAEARVQEALRRWGREPTSVPSTDVAEARAARARETIARAIAEGARVRRARRFTRVLGGASAAAALVALGWTVSGVVNDTDFELASGSARVLGSTALLPVGAELTEGDRIEAERGGARLELGSMTEVALRESSVLALAQVEETSQRLVLSQGHASFEVDPERKGSVVVDTPNARISVVGTHFHVDVERDAKSSWTTVRVDRGLVEVRREGRSILLRPGDSWSSRVEPKASAEEPRSGASSALQEASASLSGQAPSLTQPGVPADGGVHAGSAVSPASPAKGARDAAVRAPHAAAASGAPAGVAEPAQSSASQVSATQAATAQAATSQAAIAQAGTSLAEEISLYRSALSARNSGDDVRAVERLEAFMAKYPRSTLQQEATVEHFRALRRLGRDAAAARAASRYLSAYPSGFARTEAAETALPAR
jgi:ferric-dicitrate binding protein FerR (iron transport regulator)